VAAAVMFAAPLTTASAAAVAAAAEPGPPAAGGSCTPSVTRLPEPAHGGCAGLEYRIWSAVHGLAVLTGQGPLRDIPGPTRQHLEKLTSAFIGDALA
jgi:hypothetical protein